MQFLPVLLVKNKKIHVYGINVNLLEYTLQLGTVYYLTDDYINVKYSRDVLYFGELEVANAFSISDEFDNHDILYRESLTILHKSIRLNIFDELVSTDCHLERVQMKIQEEVPPYSIAFSIENEGIGLYTIPPSNTDTYIRIMGKVTIDKYNGQRIGSINLPPYKLYQENNIDGNILNYLESSVNIEYGLVFLNTVLLRYIFSRSSICDPIDFSRLALSQKTKFLN